MDLTQLRAKIAELADKRKALTDKIVSENRKLSEAEQKEFDDCGAQIKDLQDRVKVLEQVRDEQADLDRPLPRQTHDELATSANITVGRDNLIDHPLGGYGNERAHGRSDREAQRELNRAFGEFALDIYRMRSAGMSPRLRAWATATYAAGDGMTTAIGSEGGYMLPQSFGALVDRIALENSVVRPRATVVPMSTLRMTFPVVDDTTHATGTVFGGVQAYFKSEEAQLSSSKPAFASAELDLHKLTALAYVSNEMLDWSPVSIGAWLPQKLAQAIAWKEDDKFINGNGGAGEPTGLLNSPCAISVAKETGQTAATIVTNNIIKMDARLWDMAGASSIVWIANRTCKTQLPLLTVGIGAAGSLVFMPADGLAGRPNATLYGYPIVFTEKAEELGTAGDIMLCNLSEYLIGDAQGKNRSERDIGLKFDYDQTAFRVVTYTGGVCPWRSAITPAQGDSLSPVVTLAVRA